MPVQRSDSSKRSDVLFKSRYFTKFPEAEAQPQALSRADKYNHHEESLIIPIQTCEDAKATITGIFTTASTHHIFYPLTSEQRNAYRTPTGKVINQNPQGRFF